MPAGRPRKRSAPALDPGIPPRSKNHRTQTNPWEAARDESFEVEKILAERRSKGQVQYEVHSKGYTVCTRWRSEHSMTNGLRENQDAVLLFDVKHIQPLPASAAPRSWLDHRYDVVQWQKNNQIVAVLAPLANASQVLEGQKYPTSNLVLPLLPRLGQNWFFYPFLGDNPAVRTWFVRGDVTVTSARVCARAAGTCALSTAVLSVRGSHACR